MEKFIEDQELLGKDGKKYVFKRYVKADGQEPQEGKSHLCKYAMVTAADTGAEEKITVSSIAGPWTDTPNTKFRVGQLVVDTRDDVRYRFLGVCTKAGEEPRGTKPGKYASLASTTNGHDGVQAAIIHLDHLVGALPGPGELREAPKKSGSKSNIDRSVDDFVDKMRADGHMLQASFFRRVAVTCNQLAVDEEAKAAKIRGTK